MSDKVDPIVLKRLGYVEQKKMRAVTDRVYQSKVEGRRVRVLNGVKTARNTSSLVLV